MRPDLIIGRVLMAGAMVVSVGPHRASAVPLMVHGTQQQFTSAELDLLLGPVALYPDQLLAQMLLGAASPSKIVALNAWLKKNTSLKGTDLQEAAKTQGFEPSLVALALFPQVVGFMADDVAWTTQIGQAFAGDRKAVLASVQRLRAQSKEVGTLKSTPQQQVETRTTDSGQEVIVIEPTNPQIVYVPQYNAQTVYTQPTVVENNDGAAVAAGVIGFAAGIAIGAAIDNDYYYGPVGWRGGAYMYDDAWDDYYDNREDAREDWQDHREDLTEERSERAGQTQQQRTEQQAARSEKRTDAQATAQERRGTSTASQEARGTGGKERAAPDRSGAKSDAFSGYSSGKSERKASSRGSRSRGSSGGGRGGRRR